MICSWPARRLKRGGVESSLPLVTPAASRTCNACGNAFTTCLFLAREGPLSGGAYWLRAVEIPALWPSKVYLFVFHPNKLFASNRFNIFSCCVGVCASFWSHRCPDSMVMAVSTIRSPIGHETGRLLWLGGTRAGHDALCPVTQQPCALAWRLPDGASLHLEDMVTVYRCLSAQTQLYPVSYTCPRVYLPNI
eukprot:366203-Chlamydomonas_euryale.AAC.21